MTLKVAINGFGRIGRCFFRIAQQHPDLEVVAVNDLTDDAMLAYLLKYDSVHGTFAEDVSHTEGFLVVGGKKIRAFAERDPEKLPWKELDVDVVLESTGVFRTSEAAGKHLKAGARKVVLSAPAKGGDVLTVVMGVNESSYDGAKHAIISNASCTTNCAAPMVKVLNDTFGIVSGFLTTVHSYTNDQRILDLPHTDKRRARAAGLSMIPTTTGAAKAVGIVIPEMQGKLDGMSIRVPTPNVSLVDMVVQVQKTATAEAVNAAMKSAAESGPLSDFFTFETAPLVSKDYNGNSSSCTLDADQTNVIGNLVKVVGWYDNEWGYSCRLADLMSYVAGK